MRAGLGSRPVSEHFIETCEKCHGSNSTFCDMVDGRHGLGMGGWVLSGKLRGGRVGGGDDDDDGASGSRTLGGLAGPELARLACGGDVEWRGREW